MTKQETLGVPVMAEPYQGQIERHVYYQCDIGTVRFAKVSNVPGYSYRVIINGHAIDWLGTSYRPSITTARYYIGKHMAWLQECSEKVAHKEA